jgi:hypothetical protein
MGIINRRNAVLGWSVWQVAKQLGKRKAKSAGGGEHAGLKKGGAIASVFAAVGGALWFWRKKSDETPGSGS